MIIFGTKAKTKTVGSGDFFCPHCRQSRHYLRKSARPYFSLYFLPVFPIGQEKQYVECEICKLAFDPAVLQMKPPRRKPDLAAMLNTIQPRLAEGAPVEYLVRDLTAAGLDYDVARANLQTQLSADRRFCPSCELTYAGTVATCSECGGSLQAAAD